MAFEKDAAEKNRVSRLNAKPQIEPVVSLSPLIVSAIVPEAVQGKEITVSLLAELPLVSGSCPGLKLPGQLSQYPVYRRLDIPLQNSAPPIQ